jgi:GGDEF domain-containing protein
VLQEVAKALEQTTRPYDTCIRYGGDEFVVLLSSSGSAEAEEQRCRVQESVAAISLRADDGREIPLRVSAGAAVFPEDGETCERLLTRADRRMYRNKAESKTTLSTPAARGQAEAGRAQLCLVQCSDHMCDANRRSFDACWPAFAEARPATFACIRNNSHDKRQIVGKAA